MGNRVSRGVFAGLLLCLMATPAVAKSQHIVTNNAESGDGTLEWAINQANAAPDESSIIFDVPAGTVFERTTSLPAIETYCGVVSKLTDALVLRGNGSGTGFILGDEAAVIGMIIEGFDTGVALLGNKSAVAECVIRGNKNGVHLGGYEPSVFGNYIHDNTPGEGIRSGFGAADYGKILGNTVCGNGSGIYLFPSYLTQIYNNTIGIEEDKVTPHGNLGDGLTIYSGLSLQVLNNHIAYNHGSGMLLQGVNATFENNHVFANCGAGIGFFDADSNTIAPPEITQLCPIQGTVSTLITEVQLFADAYDEGMLFAGKTEVAGDLSFSVDVDLSAYAGMNLTAVGIFGIEYTSEFLTWTTSTAFSTPVAIGDGCGGEYAGEVVTQPEPECGVEPPDNDGYLTLDRNRDFVVDVDELMRVIQFYNSLGFRCKGAGSQSEDTYMAGAGEEHGCTPHDIDRAPRDWAISIDELLRCIQFYNALSFHYCPEGGTEDGFCLGVAP
jgi:hypothetical protein